MRTCKLYQIITILLFVPLFTSCQNVLQSKKSQRQILVEEVEAGQNSMVQLKQQLESARDEFDNVADAHNGNLSNRAQRLETNYETTETLADEVNTNFEDIRDAANAYFRNWESELGKYTNQELRRGSREQLEQVREKYGDLNQTMNEVEAQLRTILPAFKDRVLFMRRNLSGERDSEIADVNDDISELRDDLDDAIEESNEFMRDIRVHDTDQLGANLTDERARLQPTPPIEFEF
jgi:ElaB/YqjD/DUF883 family membrane-anchored ribosome-binding protein